MTADRQAELDAAVAAFRQRYGFTPDLDRMGDLLDDPLVPLPPPGTRVSGDQLDAILAERQAWHGRHPAFGDDDDANRR